VGEAFRFFLLIHYREPSPARDKTPRRSAAYGDTLSRGGEVDRGAAISS